MSEDEIVGYFAPNNFGHYGYSMIGPLLLYYDKLYISNPIGSLLAKAQDEFPKTTLSNGDFERYILDGVIIPLGFESFFYGNEIRHSLDKTIKNLSTNRILQLDNGFKIKKSSTLAIEILNNNKLINDNLKSIYIDTPKRIPGRYKDIRLIYPGLPAILQNHIKNLPSNEDIFPVLFIYDQLNNFHAITEIKERTEQNAIYALHRDYCYPYEELGKFIETSTGYNFQEASDNIKLRMNNAVLIGDIIAELIGKTNIERLTFEDIDNFKSHVKKDFIEYVNNLLSDDHLKNDSTKIKDRINELFEENRVLMALSGVILKCISLGTIGYNVPDFLLDNIIKIGHSKMKYTRLVFHLLHIKIKHRKRE
jgi:hypothetical protein